jgi:hypothetical protein
MSQLVNVHLQPPRSKRSPLTRTRVIGVVAGFFVLFGIILIAVQQSRENNDPGVLFEIPYGASASVPAGLISAVAMPREIIFRDGETAKITVINHDDVTHLAGPFVVAPGQTYVQTFPNPGVFPINCAVNPAESIVVKVE